MDVPVPDSQSTKARQTKSRPWNGEELKLTKDLLAEEIDRDNDDSGAPRTFKEIYIVVAEKLKSRGFERNPLAIQRKFPGRTSRVGGAVGGLKHFRVGENEDPEDDGEDEVQIQAETINVSSSPSKNASEITNQYENVKPDPKTPTSSPKRRVSDGTSMRPPTKKVQTGKKATGTDASRIAQQLSLFDAQLQVKDGSSYSTLTRSNADDVASAPSPVHVSRSTSTTKESNGSLPHGSRSFKQNANAAEGSSIAKALDDDDEFTLSATRKVQALERQIGALKQQKSARHEKVDREYAKKLKELNERFSEIRERELKLLETEIEEAEEKRCKIQDILNML